MNISVRWTSSSIIQWQRDQVIASGQDAGSIRDEGPVRFLNLKQVRELVALSPAHIYRLMARRQFPRPVSMPRRLETEAA